MIEGRKEGRKDMCACMCMCVVNGALRCAALVCKGKG